MPTLSEKFEAQDNLEQAKLRENHRRELILQIKRYLGGQYSKSDNCNADHNLLQALKDGDIETNGLKISEGQKAEWRNNGVYAGSNLDLVRQTLRLTLAELMSYEGSYEIIDEE